MGRVGGGRQSREALLDKGRYCCAFEPSFAEKEKKKKKRVLGFVRPEAYVVLEAPVEISNTKLLIQN